MTLLGAWWLCAHARRCRIESVHTQDLVYHLDQHIQVLCHVAWLTDRFKCAMHGSRLRCLVVCRSMKQICPCWHAQAVLELAGTHHCLCHDHKDISFSADHTAAVYDSIAEVQLQHDCVHAVRIDSSCWADTALSVCSKPCNSTNNQTCVGHGAARTIVGASSSGVLTCRNVQCCRQPGLRVKCQHCKAVAAWMQTIRVSIHAQEDEGHALEDLDSLVALAAGFEGLLLQADVS